MALGRTVAELEASLSAKELSEWIEFAEIEPIGAEPAFWRAGMIAATIANVNRDRAHKPEPFTPRDFMPRLAAEPEPELDDPATLWDKMVTTFAGRIVKDGI